MSLHKTTNTTKTIRKKQQQKKKLSTIEPKKKCRRPQVKSKRNRTTSLKVFLLMSKNQ